MSTRIESSPMALSPSGRRSVVPYLILVAALAVTAAAARYAFNQIAQQNELKFESAAARVSTEIETRLDAYIAMLHGGSGLFAASMRVEFNEFRAYAQRLEMPRRYPGVQGIGFSRFIPPKDRAHIEQVIRPHVPTFEYWSQGSADELHAIIFLEPENPRNQHAMGFNMFSEPSRREAMIRARDSGLPAATGPVRLVQEDVHTGPEQSGFLMYEPVYRSGAIPSTVDERRAELLGFVYSPFRAGDLFKEMIAPVEAEAVSLHVYDGVGAQARLLYATPGEVLGGTSGRGLRRDRTVSVAGRTWVLVFQGNPAAPGFTSGRILNILLAGGALSLLLFGVTRAQVRARQIAERTTEDLRRSEEALRAANRSKDEFLAIVSHELRTPLNAIVGWGSMLRRGQVPQGSERHALEVIERNALAQARLVEDLLDISRAVAGRLRLELSDVNLAATLRAAIDAVRPSAATQGVDLHLDVPDDLGIVRGDPARLLQILQNLLSNAIKFTQSGGRVSLEASMTGQEASIRVTDTGIGISPEFLPFVFDPFRQADSSTTRAHGGVGLGLAIARHLIELHGGTIDVVSEGEGRGSTFTVRFRTDKVGRRATTVRRGSEDPRPTTV
jgi:two-component system OmpR family sensor kinase